MTETAIHFSDAIQETIEALLTELDFQQLVVESCDCNPERYCACRSRQACTCGKSEHPLDLMRSISLEVAELRLVRAHLEAGGGFKVLQDGSIWIGRKVYGANLSVAHAWIESQKWS